VQPFVVVYQFNELGNAALSLVMIPIFAPVHLLGFERFHECLREGIVIRISAPAHADDCLVLLQQIRVGAAGILHAAIGVMHQPWPRPAGG
jgi:hypothetical protein